MAAALLSGCASFDRALVGNDPYVKAMNNATTKEEKLAIMNAFQAHVAQENQQRALQQQQFDQQQTIDAIHAAREAAEQADADAQRILTNQENAQWHLLDEPRR
jgi:DNA-binding helix-hairpin-helix protein with protein kinase domain